MVTCLQEIQISLNPYEEGSREHCAWLDGYDTASTGICIGTTDYNASRQPLKAIRERIYGYSENSEKIIPKPIAINPNTDIVIESCR